MTKTRGGTAPDNNKRLAALEAGVSTLAIALTANGVAVGEGDPIEIAIAIVKAAAKDRAEAAETISTMGAKIDALEKAGTEETKAELEQLRARVAELEAGPTEPQGGDQALIAAAGRIADLERQLEEAKAATGEEANDGAIATLKARVAELETEVAELQTDVDDAMSEKNRLANELANAGGPSQPPAAVDEPEEVAAPIERVRPEAARDVGADYPGIHTSADITALLAGGAVDGLELVFSNGQFEILTLQPIAIGPNDLQLAEGRNMVIPPVFAKLLNTDPQEELAGVGLLLQGEQIAYCAFPDRLTLQPGGERRFERAIFF